MGLYFCFCTRSSCIDLSHVPRYPETIVIVSNIFLVIIINTLSIKWVCVSAILISCLFFLLVFEVGFNCRSLLWVGTIGGWNLMQYAKKSEFVVRHKSVQGNIRHGCGSLLAISWGHQLQELAACKCDTLRIQVSIIYSMISVTTYGTKNLLWLTSLS